MNDENEQKDIVLPAPILLSVVICDQVIIDSISKRNSLIGIFETISAPSYPARHARLCFFCEMTNGRGNVEVMLKLVDVDNEDKMMMEQKTTIPFEDVHQVKSMIYDLNGIVFPHQGEYRFQVYAGTEFLGERRIICRTVDTGGKNE